MSLSTAWLALVSLALVVSLALALLRLRRSKPATVAPSVARQSENQRLDTLASMVVPESGAADPRVGTQIGEYRVLQLLGQGTSARVYRAVPEANPAAPQVALKILHRDLEHDAEALPRLQRERRVYEALQHPHIVRLLDAGSFGSDVYLVTEFVQGQTLSGFIRADGLPAKDAWKLLEPIFDAVAYAHGVGVVHRDLKPDNIMVSAQGSVKVMDFGLARGEEFQQVTVAGAVMGTPVYMAPEQIDGQLVPAIDQYALGVLTFQLLTGRLPFEDRSPVRLLTLHLTAPPPPLTTYKPQLQAASEVVLRMLQKHPEERYPDLAEARRQLGEALQGS